MQSQFMRLGQSPRQKLYGKSLDQSRRLNLHKDTNNHKLFDDIK